MVIPSENALNSYFANYGSHLMPPLTDDRVYTYSDYRKFGEKERWQVIEGCTHYANEGPPEIHDQCLNNLQLLFSLSLKSRGCHICIPPFDLILPIDSGDRNQAINIIHPDICIINEHETVENGTYYGSPDLIVEIISRSTVSLDYRDKVLLYEKYLVKEYWVVDPHYKLVHVHQLSDCGRYDVPSCYYNKDIIRSGISNGIIVDLNRLFYHMA